MSEAINNGCKNTDEAGNALMERKVEPIDDDFEHEEIIGNTKWDNAADFIDIDRVIDLPNSANAFIVNTKGVNVTMQEAYYLPVSPDNSQCWQIQRDDKFLIEADQANSFDIYTGDFSAPNVLRVSVIQKTPQNRNPKDDSIVASNAIPVNDAENLTESIWGDYTISQIPTLESNLDNVITEDLMDATDIVDGQLLQNVESETVVLQPASAVENDETLVTCRCCNKNFTFYDLKLHIAEKSTEGYYGCDRCSEIFLLKEDLNNHLLTHLTEDTSFNCAQCEVKLEDQAALIEHKKIHIPFRCSYCMEDFVDVLDLDMHINQVHATKRVKTELSQQENQEQQDTVPKLVSNENPRKSDSSAPKIANLQNADTAKEENTVHIQCPKCKEKFSFAAEAEIDTYIKTHTPTTYYKCGFCDTIVTDKNEFNEHMKNHTTVVETNSGNKFPYKCSYCDNLAFATIEELTSHIEMHVPRSFVCPKCRAQFVRENRRQETVLINRQAVRKDPTMNKLKTTAILAPADKLPTRENLTCKTCAAEFKRQDEFNKHVKTHIMPDTKLEVSDVKVDPSYCAYCSSELLSIAEIIVHIRKHTEERKLLPCSNCDKKTNHDRSSQNSNNRGKENLCNYCLSKSESNVKVHG